MKLQDLVGKTVEVDGLDEPVVLQCEDGNATYKDSEGTSVVVGRLSDSVSASGGGSVRLSRLEG